MSDGFQIVEIVFLAMLAGFIALRLVSVLGRRTGHERTPPTDVYADAKAEAGTVAARTASSETPAAREVVMPDYASVSLRDGLQRIAQADPGFSPDRFEDGARAAYRIVLEAFWRADLDSLKPLVSDDVYDNFAQAAEARRTEGHTLDNRIVAIDSAHIVAADLQGAMAEVTVRFVSQLVAVTRDAGGAVIHGSVSDSVEVHDVWTFSRHTRAEDPNWLLIATDSD